MRSRMRWLRMHSVLPSDVVLAALLTVIAQVEIMTRVDLPGSRPLIAASALVLTALVLLRRRNPLLLATVAVAYFPIVFLVGWDVPDFAFYPSGVLILASYSVAAHGALRTALTGAAVVAGVMTTMAIVDPPGSDPLAVEDLFFILGFNGTAWAAGRLVRSRQEQADLAQSRAEIVERSADERARLAAEEERVRIARELHDIVAHSISAMILQIGAVRNGLEPEAKTARDGLEGAERTGRQALDEMRRLVGVLRTGDAPERAPQPGVDKVRDLVEAAQFPVNLAVEGSLEGIPPGPSLAGYRIVQEALTNIRKHAHASAAEVRLERVNGELRIEVRDDGRGPAGGEPGHGLVGMRERVAIYGGEFEAGGGEDGGFVVRAWLLTHGGA